MKSNGDYFYVKKVELKTNYTQIPNELFYVDLTATEKLILAYLLSNTKSFGVTHYRIAKSLGSDHRTVKKALKKFRDMNLIFPKTNKTFGININEIIKLSTYLDKFMSVWLNYKQELDRFILKHEEWTC